MNIREKIEKFQETKEKIRQAIISKGVDVPEGASLSVMADKILKYRSKRLREANQHDVGSIYFLFISFKGEVK